MKCNIYCIFFVTFITSDVIHIFCLGRLCRLSEELSNIDLPLKPFLNSGVFSIHGVGRGGGGEALPGRISGFLKVQLYSN